MIRKNNTGASLIFIIACIAVVTVVGLAVLVVTTQNREMKMLEGKAQETFYEADGISDELVIALESLAQEAAAEAYADLLLQYTVSEEEAAATGVSAKSVRLTRYFDYFAGALKKKIEDAGSLQALFETAMGISDAEALGISIGCGGTVTEPEEIEVAGDRVYRKNIRLKDVTFSFTAADGYQTKIITDLVIRAKNPEGERTLGNPGKNHFAEYALLTPGSVTALLGSGQPISINGSVYSGGTLALTSSTVSMTIENAKQVLVKDTVTVDKAALTIKNNETEKYTGVWAGGIDLKSGGALSIETNCYVADDLEIEGNGTSFVMSGAGKEYVGYSGGVGDTADSSAITINKASDITLDLSGLERLCLTGNSYIKDEVWGNASLETSMKLGVLQGESVAYKEMQAAYLVPGECLKTGYNPMPKSDFEACGGTVADCLINLRWLTKKNGVVTEWDLSRYLDATEPVVTRYVQFDGGTTVFVYLYLNFASEEAAAEYFREYMNTEQGAGIKAQMSRMDALGAGSVIKLAMNNYLLGNGIVYDAGGLRLENPLLTPEERARLIAGRITIKKRKESLFYGLHANAAVGTMGAGYDVVTDKLLNMETLRGEPAALVYKQVAVGENRYDFYVYNGEGSTCTITENANVNGIILVNGKLNISATTFHVNGLVIATEGVEFTSGATLRANETVVNEMLSVQDVGKFFKGYGMAPEAGGTASSDAVEISFEEWKKN